MKALQFLKHAALIVAAASLVASCRTVHSLTQSAKLREDSTRAVSYDSSRTFHQEATQGRHVDSAASAEASTTKAGRVVINFTPGAISPERSVLYDPLTHTLKRKVNGQWVQVTTDTRKLAPAADSSPPLEVEITPINGKDYTNGVKIKAPGNTQSIEVDGADISQQSHLVNFSSDEAKKIVQDDSQTHKGTDSAHLVKQLQTQQKQREVKGGTSAGVVILGSLAALLLLAVLILVIYQRFKSRLHL